MSRPKKIETESNVAQIGHNSVAPERIVQWAKEMAEIDAARKKLNSDAGDIRQAVKDAGVDRDAFRESYQYFKKKRHEREGFDESYKICWDALNAADTGEMFAFQDDKA